MNHPIDTVPLRSVTHKDVAYSTVLTLHRHRSSSQIPRRTASKHRPRPVLPRIAAVVLIAGALITASFVQFTPFGSWLEQDPRSRAVSAASGPSSSPPSTAEAGGGERKVRDYNLTLVRRWVNPDGGGSRLQTTCNGQFLCRTLRAEEGDLVGVTLFNRLGSPRSIHWAGIGHRVRGSWEDEASDLTQRPVLPQDSARWVFDTAGQWGLGWYMERTMGQGLYGGIWVAPAPDRARPYRLLAETSAELVAMHEAERSIKHLLIADHTSRDPRSQMFRARAEGRETHCADSILVNGKGRVHCHQDGQDNIDGRPLDERGCAAPQFPPGAAGSTRCRPTLADYELLEIAGGGGGARYMMLNLLNAGLGHAVRVSIDAHEMVVVADGRGFVRPARARIVELPVAARATVLVRLDREPADYAVRIASTSSWQNLQGYAVLRYPSANLSSQSAVGPSPQGLRMRLPQPPRPEDQYLSPDGSAAVVDGGPGVVSASHLRAFSP